MKRLHLILLFLILFLVPNVYASDYKLNSHISATSGGTKNRYGGLENYNYGSYGSYTFGTRYQGRLGNIETYIDYPFESNKTYTLTYNMNTEDFINHFGSSYWWDCSQAMTNSNATVQSVNYISYKKIKFTFTPTDNTTCIYVSIRSTNPSSTAITQITNWQLDSIYLYDPDYQGSGGSGGSGGTPTPTPTSDPNQAIIDNNNQNTSDVIDNANENTDKIIDNQKDLLGNCYYNILRPSNYIDSDGYRGYLVELEEGETYTLLNVAPDNFGFKIGSSIYGYTDVEQWTVSSNRYTFTYHKNSNNTGNSYTYLFFANSNHINNLNSLQFVLTKGNYNGGFIPYGTEKCTSKLDDTNAYLTDDSDPNISDNEFTTLFDSVNINNPLSSLLQLPVQFINAIVNQSNSCQVVSLGTLLGVPITLPCIDIGSIIGSNVWNIIDILSSIGLIVLILKQMYESITNALTLGGYMDAKKGGLGYMPPLEFLCSILTIGERDI